jgi:hypothetical protein
MDLVYKPNLDEAKKYWRAFWAGEIIDRPCIGITTRRPDAKSVPGPPGLNGFHDPDQVLPLVEECLSQMLFLAEAMPAFVINFGPDQFAAWVGADLHYEASSGETSWSVPMVNDWPTDGRDIDRPHGVWWDKALDYYRRAAEYAEGKFVLGFPDFHSNMDALSALRGPQNLCMDLWDVPDEIDSAMNKVKKAFAPMYEALEDAGRMPGAGYTTWLPFYSEGRYAALQCDFACMVGPEHFRRWILPALEEESSYLDHSVYHYDGPDALVHLHDVLSIPGIRAIQWVPGSGNPPVIEWMDLLKEMQKAGKALFLGASPDEVKIYHRELRPEGVFYYVGVSSEKEADDLLAWLKHHT